MSKESETASPPDHVRAGLALKIKKSNGIVLKQSLVRRMIID
jgi:hypothetical protein